MCSCNVLAIKQRKINFGRQRSVVDNLRLVWVIQKGQTGQALSCKRGELKTENLYLYHSRKSKIFALHCSLGYLLPNLANWIVKRSNLDICSFSSTNWIYLPLLPFYVFAPTYSTLIQPISNPNSFVCSPVQYRVYFCISWLLYAVFPHPQFQRPLSVSNPNFMCLLPSSIFHKLWTLWLQPRLPVWRPLLFSEQLK